MSAQKSKTGVFYARFYIKIMLRSMKCYKQNGKRVVEIDDLTFISNRNHRLGWLGLHFTHFRIKFALCRADMVIVPDETVAWDVFRYYFFPKDRIFIAGADRAYSESFHNA